MNPDWLAYFKDVIEGRASRPWHVWWREYHGEIEAALGRITYLKLKFEKLEFASTLLAKHGVPFEWSAIGRHAIAYGNLDPSVLDDLTGRPRPEFRERDGSYIQAFCTGNHEHGHALVQKEIRRIRRIRDEVRRSEELRDLEFDAEGLLEEGYEQVAVVLLTAIARWKNPECLEKAAVEYAQVKLDGLGYSWLQCRDSRSAASC